MNEVRFRRIGTIHSPFKTASEIPIQARRAGGIRGRVDVLPEFGEGLRDLSGFSHVYLLYHFHEAAGMRLSVVPFLDSRPRGVFATRAPVRPNPLGLSVVRLREVKDLVLFVENLDILDGTPLLDIKPYIPAFDHWDVESTGWLSGKVLTEDATRSDERFTKK